MTPKPPTLRNRTAPAGELTMAPIGASGPTRGTLSWDPDNDSYVFATDGTAYRVIVGAEDEQSGLLRIEGRLGDGSWQPLVRAGGMLFREREGAILPPHATHQRWELQEMKHAMRGRILALRYSEHLEGRTLRRSVEIRPVGRSLEIAIRAPGGRAGEGFCGFSLGRLGPEASRPLPIPGLPEPLLVLPEGGFLAGYADRYRGHASAYPPGGAFYRMNTDGVSAAVNETFYVTLSAAPLDPLPGLRRPAAPFRIALSNRVVLDYYSEAPYAEDERFLSLLPAYGLADVLLIYRNWQQFGYRRRQPAFYPADPNRGDNDAFRRMLDAVREAGWLVALREEYALMAPDSPYRDEKAPAVWWDGQPRLAKGGQYGIAAHRMIEFARLEATKIARNYRPTATFVDGHTAWNPEEGFHQVDSSPGSPSGTEAQAIRHLEGLLAFLRDVHEGPLVGAAGEGVARFDTFAEGLVEGAIRGPDGGRSAPLVVDYELAEVRPKLVGIGAGTYRQFCGLPTDEPVDPSRIDWDAYRATEIALGHAGYVGNYRLKPGPRGLPVPGGSAAGLVREYFLLRALQELYLEAPLRAVHYACGEEWLDLAEAARRGIDLAQARLRIEYGNGLTIWVNRSAEEGWRAGPDEAPCELPPGGFLAVAPRGRLLAYSARVEGRRTDFCRSPHYTFVDTRGGPARTVEGITVDGGVALLKSAVQGRQDVILVGARQLGVDGAEYRLSERADVRLAHLSPRELEIIVLDSESGKPIHVAFPAFSAPWSGNRFRIMEREGAVWRESRSQVQPTRIGPQVSRLRPGVRYRVTALAS